MFSLRCRQVRSSETLARKGRGSKYRGSSLEIKHVGEALTFHRLQPFSESQGPRLNCRCLGWPERSSLIRRAARSVYAANVGCPRDCGPGPAKRQRWLLAGCCRNEHPWGFGLVKAHKLRQRRWRNPADRARIVLRKSGGITRATTDALGLVGQQFQIWRSDRGLRERRFAATEACGSRRARCASPDRADDPRDGGR
jgi:hypothetical protein